MHQVAAVSANCPALVLLVKTCRSDAGFKLNIGAQLEAVSHVVDIAQDLILLRVAFSPMPLLLELFVKRIGILHAFDIAPCAGIAVPVPCSANAVASLIYAGRQAQLAKAVKHVQASEAGTDDNHIELLGFCGIVNGQVCLLARKMAVPCRPWLKLCMATWVCRGAAPRLWRHQQNRQ